MALLRWAVPARKENWVTTKATEYLKSKLRTSWGIVFATCATVLGIAGVVEALGTHIHDSISSNFFVVCGTVAPLFGLALFVDIGVVMAPIVKTAGATDPIRDTTKTFVRINSGMLLISESSSLYAAATDLPSAFLVACAVLPWAVQLYLLAATTYHRAGVRQVGGPRQ